VVEFVLDASALIAFLRKERGADKVEAALTRSCISAVNLAESFGKMVEYGKPLEAVAYQVERLQIPVVPFDTEMARVAASLWKVTRGVGMSLGDRACLSLALKTSAAALTTEQEAWDKVDVGVKIIKIR
jgi:PIN domain nuclease of toxin-antitoxin system